MLLDSFTTLLDKHKAISAISVQSITEQAGVNRATFYAHFSDKYELMAIWKRELFWQALNQGIATNHDSSEISFDQLIDTVLRFMIRFRRYFKRINREYEPLFESAVQQEIKTIITQMLRQSLPKEAEPRVESTATFLSWAIFGSANEWSRQPNGVSKIVITEQLTQLVKIVVAQSV